VAAAAAAAAAAGALTSALGAASLVVLVGSRVLASASARERARAVEPRRIADRRGPRS
jgi:hypothetical protein